MAFSPRLIILSFFLLFLIGKTVPVLTFCKGWRFATPDEKIPGDNVTPDPIHPEFTHLRDIYFSVDPEYKGRFTVPTLYDKKTKRIVSNEVCIFFSSIYLKDSSQSCKSNNQIELRDHPHVLLRIR